MGKTNYDLDVELREREEQELADASEDDEKDDNNTKVSKRGRPKIPLQWSRLLHVTPDLSSTVPERHIVTDL